MDSPPMKIAVVSWQPFFERGKFRYWVQSGRGTVTIGKDGKPRTRFYSHSHVSGGSIWTCVLPEGETPEDLTDEQEKQARRPAQPALDADEDDGVDRF